MNLLKTSFYTSISTTVTFLCGFISIKVIAIKIGPEGIAQLGQYQNIATLFALAGTVSLSVGIAKYVAEFNQDPLKRRRLISTALTTVIISSLIISTIVIICSKFLAGTVLHNTSYWKIYVLFGSFLCLISLNIVFSAILNGLKEIKKLTLINVTGSLVGVGFTVMLANYFGVEGVLVSANFTALVIFIMNLVILNRIPELTIKPALKGFDKTFLIMLLSYALMSIVSGALIPLNQLFIRDFIIKKFSFTEAGYWQAITRISDYYLLFIISVLSAYYLPVLSGISENDKIKKEIYRGYKIILPVIAILTISIYFSRLLIIKLLFTNEFIPMKELFLFQLLGDFLKIGSWLLSFLMAAKAMIRTYIITEIIFSISLILFTRLFITNFGLIGTTYAFVLNYGLYWVTMAILMRKYLFK